VKNAVVIALALICAVSPAFAGAPDGLRVQLWTGASPEPPDKNIQFADCTLNDGGSVNTVHDPNLYIMMNGVQYSGYDLPYPTDEWQPVTWHVIADIAETSTLRLWSSNVWNPDIRFGVHGTDIASGDMMFHGPVYDDMQVVTLDPGRYQFNVTASTIATVPEPGSMVALLSGVIGLAGYGLRRRRA